MVPRLLWNLQPKTSGNLMNRHLTLDILDTGRFMTLFYMKIYPENKMLQWVRAGHDPAIIYDPGENKFEELNGAGLALGVDGNYALYRFIVRI